MGSKKNVTFSDIAKYTNFSKTTISRYFNNPDSLTLENQQIISDALVKLNYQENKVAPPIKRFTTSSSFLSVIKARKANGSISRNFSHIKLRG